MIRFEHVTITYPEAEAPTLVDVSFEVPEGELCLVVGVTGSGKSTLLRAVNGLVPRFSGGVLAGSVVIDGKSTADLPPRDLADVVGVVGQDPAAGFVTDYVEDELAYAMENLGVAPEIMRRRVEDILDLLGLHEIRYRPLASLSGGQQQRVAIGAVLTAGPRVLVLDEPTSALDPAAAEEVLAALTRLVHDLGITVLIAEHRLERVVQYADRIVMVPGDGRPVIVGTPAEVFGQSSVAPPVVELGRLAGWSPLPLSVRDARRLAGPLRERLAEVELSAFRRTPGVAGDVVAITDGLQASYGPVTALRGIELQFRAGEVVALMGRNGAGKSTLLNHLVGLREPASGTVRVMGAEPHRLSAHDVVRVAGLVPQDSGVLLYHDTVAAECSASDRDAGLIAGTTRSVLDQIVPDIKATAHPRDLSEGQRLGLALSIVLASEPPLLLLDEPTRGLDYGAKQRLVEVLGRLAAEGHAVVIATHDVEVVAAVADRCVVLAEGEVVSDGPARDVVIHSPVFAPQVAKILAPLPLLTVHEVELALAAVGDLPIS
ncbi:MAG: ATP-binding cassette domain-containing protein [Actinobacteria bacterium]|nr:ATP-binding cassette domain-containing protein [Actinomycetota bacterium]